MLLRYKIVIYNVRALKKVLKLAKQYKSSPFLVLVECLCLADLVRYVSLFEGFPS